MNESSLIKTAKMEAQLIFKASPLQNRGAIVGRLTECLMNILRPTGEETDEAAGECMMASRLALKEMENAGEIKAFKVNSSDGSFAFYIDAHAEVVPSESESKKVKKAIDLNVAPVLNQFHCLSNETVLMDYLKAGAELLQDGNDAHEHREYSLAYGYKWIVEVPQSLGDALNALKLVHEDGRTVAPNSSAPRFILRWTQP